MNKTWLTTLFGIKYPIIQAPMAGIQKSAMTIAVSNSGCLGSLPCAMLSASELRDEITKITNKTSQPYNVNFFCHKTPEIDSEREKSWKKCLALKYYEEFQINTSDENNVKSTRLPFDNEMADVMEEFKPPVVSFHFGLPSSDLLTRVKSWNSKIISTATTVEEAIWLESQGVDAIIAQGTEAGGHRGTFQNENPSTQMGLFSLLPQVVNSVKVPVIAAGGIVDKKTVNAAIKLGASGIQVGTAFMLCHEATTSEIHRNALGQPNIKTAITNVFTGKPARGIVNRLVRELGPISDQVPEFPRAANFLTALREKAESRKCGDFSPLWAGQNVSGCKQAPCSEIINELIKGLE